MDLLIIVLLIIAVVVLCRDAKFVFYLLGALEIFFELAHYIGDHFTLVNINTFINKYIPSSLFSVVGKYTTGVVYEIISWLLVIVFIIFLVYLIKYLIKIK